jgi:hypothetical protein
MIVTKQTKKFQDVGYNMMQFTAFQFKQTFVSQMLGTLILHRDSYFQ